MFLHRINQRLSAARSNDCNDCNDCNNKEEEDSEQDELPASFNPASVAFGDLSSEEEEEAQEEEKESTTKEIIAMDHKEQSAVRTASPPSFCPVTHTIFPVSSTDPSTPHQTLQSRILSTVVLPGSVPGDQLEVSVGGHRIALTVPEGASVGSTIQFTVHAPERAFNTTNHENDDGATYTSGEEGECSFGPTMLTSQEWHRRHPSPSRFRASTRPYRSHNFHNQKASHLYSDQTFQSILDAPIDPNHQVHRATYASVCQEVHGFDPYCIGKEGIGQPVVLTHVPKAASTMKAFSVDALRNEHSLLSKIPVRVCKAFTWGKNKVSGRLPLQAYFRLVTQYPKADVPFYVFEDQIGGCTHTRVNYKDVDDWVKGGEPTQPPGGTTSTNQGRNAFSTLYDIPSLFSTCMLRVPYLLRPRSTDGVLLVGCQRTGSFPHVDPGFTGAWNWMLDGVKRWCLFPPHVSREIVCGGTASGSTPRANVSANLTGEGAAYWWANQYPALKHRAKELGMVEVLQQPGELIYVPAGWWHSVVNVTEWTVAVTHNVVLPRALPFTFQRAYNHDPVFARRWWRCLCHFAPRAAQQLRKKNRVVVENCLLGGTKEKCYSICTGMYNGVYNETVARIDKELSDDDDAIEVV